MPSYGTTSEALAQSGALVAVRFGVYPLHENNLRKSGKPVPPPESSIAMIDTGADTTVVREGLLSPLGLQPVGVVPMTSATHKDVPCPQFAVTMHFPPANMNMTWSGPVVEMPMPMGLDCLIGRDVLSHGVLVYSGVTKSWTFSL